MGEEINVINSIKTKKDNSNYELTINNVKVSDPKIIADSFNEVFTSHMSKKMSANNYSWKLTENNDTFYFTPTTDGEIVEVINREWQKFLFI